MKPVKQSELFDAIVRALGVTAPEVDESHISEDADAEMGPLNVLLVEDNVVNQKLARGVLEMKGHRVTVASNGRESLDLLARQRFDVVLMDVQMPVMDGLEATRAIRAREQETGQHVPVIAMTAHAMKGDREQCLEAGMDEYLAKPIRVSQLMAKFASVLAPASKPASETAVAASNPLTVSEPLAVSEPRAAVEPAEAIEPAAGGMFESSDAAEPVDWDKALATMGGNRRLLKEVLEALVEESSILMTRIRDALAASDTTAIAAAAHTLKGVACSIAAAPLAESAQAMEVAGSEDALEKAKRLLADLESRMDHVTECVQERLEELRDEA